MMEKGVEGKTTSFLVAWQGQVVRAEENCRVDGGSESSQSTWGDG